MFVIFETKIEDGIKTRQIYDFTNAIQFYH